MKKHIAALAGAVVLIGCGARSDLEPGATSTGADAGGGATSSGGAGAAGGGSDCDHDGDGHTAPSCGGDDCDDESPAIHPGADDSNVVMGPWVSERVIENIPGDVRGQPAITLDKDGAVHITHGEAGLRYATNRTGAWIAEVIDADAHGPTSLQVDAGGSIHASYVSPLGLGLRYATGTSGAWSLETVDKKAAGASSLALDASGRPYVLYAAMGNIELARRSPSAWGGLLSVEGGAGATSLVITGEETVHMTFSVVNGASNSGVWYMTTADPDGEWDVELLASGANVASTSVALDASGAAHVAFSLSWTLHHSTNESGAWISELLDDTATIWSVSLATSPIDPDRLHVVYEGDGIQYAGRSGGAWSLSTVVPSGYGVSCATDPSGALHIARSGFNFNVNTFVDYVTNRAVVPDGIDQNCDGTDGADADQDGYASIATGGVDCDDQSVAIHPGAPDEPGDGVDEDCNGVDGAG